MTARGQRPHGWTDEERDIVRRDFDGTDIGAARIGALLGATFRAVKYQAAKMGICSRITRRPWSDAEDEQLAELITRFGVDHIAKLMGRTANAVTTRAKVLGLSRRGRDGWYNKRDVGDVLGATAPRVQRWIQAGWLKGRPHTNTVPQQGSGAAWHFTEAAVRRFIIEHPGELTGRNVDMVES